MAASRKWIADIEPDAGVSDAARCSLEARLSTVAHWLPLAAERADEDLEYVHQLRVSTRRAMAALELYEGYLPRRRARWFKKRLKKIRRAAGAARDLDVLIERVQKALGERGAGLVEKLRARRTEAQPAILDVAVRSRRKDRFQRKSRKLLQRVHPRGKSAGADGEPTFRDWGRQQLSERAQAFFDAMPARDAEPAALHQFRIAGKQLRYAMELLAPAFGDELRNNYYPVVEELQEHLGRINDQVTAGEQLREWRDSSDGESQEVRDWLHQHDASQLDDEIREFHEWWTDERIEYLRSGLGLSPPECETA